jgi:hypothetical protein
MHHDDDMSDAKRSGNEPEQVEPGSWAAESLPFAVRKELLERELRRLGFRSAAQQQQQPQGNSHPQADAGAGEHEHAD